MLLGLSAVVLLCMSTLHAVAGAGAARSLLQSTCENEGGSCIDVSQCPSPVAGICPGATNIQCCYPGAGSACNTPAGSGTCRVEGRQSCGGSFYAGYCPGPARVKCCVASSGGGSYTDIIPIPSGINPRYSTGLRSTLQSIFGTPCSSPTTTCKAPTGGKTTRNFQTLNVGPFTVTGLAPAVQALQRIFSRVQAEKPGLFAVVHNLGMACCRYTAGTTAYSTHSWGSAIDLQIGSTQADLNKDGYTYRGLVELYPYFEAEGFYWGAGFSTNEDPVHFEVSEQKLQQWNNAGLFVA